MTRTTTRTMMRRMQYGVLAALCLLAAAGTSAHAQSTADSLPAIAIDTAVQRQIARARSLVEAGQGDTARVLLDSLVAAQSYGSEELAEALYWRAVLGDRAGEAERDWVRLVIDVPLSPRAPDALLWLSELELVRGHPAVARSHLERLLRDHANAPQRTKAMLRIARSWFDEQDPARACATLSTIPLGTLPEGELRLQANDLGNRCAAYAAQASAAVGTTTTTGAATSDAASGAASSAAARDSGATDSATATAARGRFSVQLGAFPTRAEADRAVRRLASRGVQARVDGSRKPFRVRTGRYETRAAATSALAALKKKGHAGFVAEITP